MKKVDFEKIIEKIYNDQRRLTDSMVDIFHTMKNMVTDINEIHKDHLKVQNDLSVKLTLIYNDINSLTSHILVSNTVDQKDLHQGISNKLETVQTSLQQTIKTNNQLLNKLTNKASELTYFSKERLTVNELCNAFNINVNSLRSRLRLDKDFPKPTKEKSTVAYYKTKDLPKIMSYIRSNTSLLKINNDNTIN